MSQIKKNILKLIATSQISGRIRQILELHKSNPHYDKLAYHNADHVAAVLNLFEVLRKLSGKGFSKQDLKCVELAIAFHDINHSGHPDSEEDGEGLRNISRAIQTFNKWPGHANISDDEYDLIADLIAHTCYPHDQLDDSYCGQTGRGELLAMVRDADILWGMLPGNAEQSMLGMWAERRNSGLESEEIDILKLLTGQIQFIQNYRPQSAAGRTFKNAMMDDASSAWSLVALQYQRQLMAAEMISQMPDADVLKLAAAMRPVVQKQMVEEVEQSLATDTPTDPVEQ